MNSYLFYEYFQLETAIKLVGSRRVIAKTLEDATKKVEVDTERNAGIMNAVSYSYRYAYEDMEDALHE